MLTLENFEEASEIVKKVTQETKLIKSSYFSELTGNRVFLKPENMQRTGAYKVRGAYYKISTLSDEEREKGLITASAGNHAQGVAYAAHKFGVRCMGFLVRFQKDPNWSGFEWIWLHFPCCPTMKSRRPEILRWFQMLFLSVLPLWQPQQEFLLIPLR